MEAKVISRGTGRSAVAAAAYITQIFFFGLVLPFAIFGQRPHGQHDMSVGIMTIRIVEYPKSTKYGRQNPISERWNSEDQLVLWRTA